MRPSEGISFGNWGWFELKFGVPKCDGHKKKETHILVLTLGETTAHSEANTVHGSRLTDAYPLQFNYLRNIHWAGSKKINKKEKATRTHEITPFFLNNFSLFSIAFVIQKRLGKKRAQFFIS